MYKEMNEKCNGKGRFEEWIPESGAHGKGISSGGRVRQRSRSTTPSAALDGGLKIGGLIKKVCHDIRHWGGVLADAVVRLLRSK
jgi:hypothetical protein